MVRGRALLLLVLVLVLGMLSFWPLRSGWSTTRVADRWEQAWLELRHPFHSVSDRAERCALKAAFEPPLKTAERHVVVIRGGAMRLWVDGRTIVNLLQVPSGPLAWSSRLRLWVGGAPGARGPTVKVGRVAFYDRALTSAQVRALHHAGSRGGSPTEVPEPVLALGPVEGRAGGTLSAVGVAGPVSLTIPPDAVEDGTGLWLTGTPAVSTRPVERLAERVRSGQAMTMELWLSYPERPASGRRPVVAIAEPGGATNLRVELGRADAEVLVRTAYPSLRRVWDGVLNLVAYVPLGLILAWGGGGMRALVGAFLLAAGMSGTVEVLQLFAPDRIPSFLDLAANTAGAMAGALLGLVATGRGPGSPPAR